MATRNFPVSADATVEGLYQPSLTTAQYFGAAAPGVHLPVGRTGAGQVAGGSKFRSFLKFSLDWTGVQTIISASLYLRSDGVWHGASPSQFISRVTGAWSETGVTWNNQPAVTAAGQVTSALGAAFNTWYAVDITDIVLAWAPASIPGGGGASNLGLRLLGDGEASTADSTVFADRESGYAAYIVLTYSSNAAPNAPFLNSPIVGNLVSSQTPTVNFTPLDPDGDTHIQYIYEVDDDPAFGSLYETGTVGGSFPNGVAVDRVLGNALVRGGTYYWRARTRDASLYGPFSGGQAFKIGSLPTTAVTLPAAGHTCSLWYTAGTTTTPKIRVHWSFSDADGHAQTHFRVYIYADSAGSPGANVYDSGWTVGTDAFFNTTYAVTNGTKYHVSVQVRCSLTLESLESTKNITRVRWGRASYFFDGTSTPTSLFVENSQTVAATEWMVLEYATTASTTEPTTWYANIASAGLNRYFWHRVTMWGWASATPSSPDLNSLTWSYSALALSLDRWSLASGGVVDTGTYVYGTQSLRHACNGAAQRTYQIVNVLPNKEIVLSGRIKVSGNPAAKLRIMSDDGTVELAAISAPTATTDWARYTTPAIDTGSESQVRVECYTSAAGGNTAWFDALKLEESAVATPWTPGFVSGAVTVDAGGLGIDASRGGVMRFRGSGGAANDIVELGVHGLQFSGGIFELAGAGTSFPTSPAPNVGDVFYRTDLGDFFVFYSGAYWVSMTEYSEPIGYANDQSASGDLTADRLPGTAGFPTALLLTYFDYSAYVNGGTALGASHSWVLRLKSFVDNTATNRSDVTFNSGASDTWRSAGGSALAVIVSGISMFQVSAVKTGTPGNMSGNGRLRYRLAATN